MLIRSFFLLSSLLLLPCLAQAHKIHVFAWVSHNTITVESSFSSNRPLVKGTVTVQDNKSKDVLLEGIGDAKGIFTFEIPSVAKKSALDLLIIVSGGEGHQSQWLVPASEYLSGHVSVPSSKQSSEIRQAAPPEVSKEELKKIIGELLEKELAPIKRSLAAAENKKPDFRDIMGGIGYLLGLAGLISWMKNRKPKGQSNK